jgi:hypothetical protein
MIRTFLPIELAALTKIFFARPECDLEVDKMVSNKTARIMAMVIKSF